MDYTTINQQTTKKSCCIWYDGDASKTGLSSVGGGGGGGALTTSLVATPIFHWTMDRGTLNVPMLDEFGDRSVGGGCLSFKQ